MLRNPKYIDFTEIYNVATLPREMITADNIIASREKIYITSEISKNIFDSNKVTKQ